MIRTNLFSRNEIAAIESAHADHVLLRLLKGLTREWPRQDQQFALSAADAFYLTMYAIDMLRGMADAGERMTYCEGLWKENYSYLAENVDAEKQDIYDAASLVTGIVSACLFALNPWHFMAESQAAQSPLDVFVIGQRQRLQQLLSPFVKGGGNVELKKWLNEYWTSELCLSDDIEDSVQVLRKAAEDKALREEILRNGKNEVYMGNSVHNDNRTIIKLNNQTDKLQLE